MIHDTGNGEIPTVFAGLAQGVRRQERSPQPSPTDRAIEFVDRVSLPRTVVLTIVLLAMFIAEAIVFASFATSTETARAKRKDGHGRYPL